MSVTARQISERDRRLERPADPGAREDAWAAAADDPIVRHAYERIVEFGADPGLLANPAALERLAAWRAFRVARITWLLDGGSEPVAPSILPAAVRFAGRTFEADLPGRLARLAERRAERRARLTGARDRAAESGA